MERTERFIGPGRSDNETSGSHHPKQIPGFTTRECQGFSELIHLDAVPFKHLKVGSGFHLRKVELTFENLSNLVLVDWLALEGARNRHTTCIRNSRPTGLTAKEPTHRTSRSRVAHAPQTAACAPTTSATQASRTSLLRTVVT